MSTRRDKKKSLVSDQFSNWKQHSNIIPQTQQFGAQQLTATCEMKKKNLTKKIDVGEKN